jgi:hypothetical protein
MNIYKKSLFTLLIIFTFTMPIFAAVCTPTTPPNHLEFVAPSTNTDGTTLTDLAGFKLYFSNTSNTEGTGTVKDVAMDGATGPGATGNIPLSSLGLLDNKTYYFKISAYDTAGLESALSNEVSCTYDATLPNAPSAIIVK